MMATGGRRRRHLEVAPGNEWRRERLEVLRRDAVEANAPAVLGTLHEPLNVDKQAACRAGHRRHRGVRGRTHAWNQHQPLEQPLLQRCELRGRRAAMRAIQPELQNGFTRKSDAHCSKGRQVADEQDGSAQEHE